MGGVANVTAPYARLGHDLFYGLEKEVSMFLKFAAVGSLTVLSPFGLPARADRVRKFGAKPCDPLLAVLGFTSQAELSKTPEAGKRAADRTDS